MPNLSNAKSLLLNSTGLKNLYVNDKLVWCKRKDLPYLCEVEYLESSGTQYIDTGVKATVDLTTELTAGFSSYTTATYPAICGTITSDTNSTGRYYPFARNPKGNRVNFGQLSINPTAYFGTDFDTHEIVFNDSQHRVYVDGSLLTTYSASGFTNPNLNIFLFAGNTPTGAGNFANCRIAHVKFVKGDNVLGDFIPVLDWNDTPCMYDKVSNKFFYNKGTDVFKHGKRIKPLYKYRVDYLESDTGVIQYIDTEYNPNGKHPVIKLKFIPKITTNSGNQGIFGIWGPNDTRLQIVGNSIGIGTFVNKTWTKNTLYEVTLDTLNLKAIVNGTTITGFTNNGFPNVTLPLFTRHDLSTDIYNESVGLKIYYCKIYENDELKRDLMPVIDWNNRPCMYDKVSNKLFYNKGNSEFKYGNLV